LGYFELLLRRDFIFWADRNETNEFGFLEIGYYYFLHDDKYKDGC